MWSDEPHHSFIEATYLIQGSYLHCSSPVNSHGSCSGIVNVYMAGGGKGETQQGGAALAGKRKEAAYKSKLFAKKRITSCLWPSSFRAYNPVIGSEHGGHNMNV
jgi:hypothetical protein